jgi:hypothetical protein
MALDFDRFTQVGPSQGSNPGGTYTDETGDEWYLKRPTSRRQAHNEVMAAQMYDMMGFDALDYQMVDNGMVASRIREGLPQRSDPDDLQSSRTVQEAFLPSAWLANFDVIGMVYDNCLYDPDTMSAPVFLDFGGAFDTRAQNGRKQYPTNQLRALDGFTDRSINRSATRVFSGMTAETFQASRERVTRLSMRDIQAATAVEGFSDTADRVSTLEARQELVASTTYSEVFNPETPPR